MLQTDETMNTTTTTTHQHHASKSMNTLIRLREQHKTKKENDEECVEAATKDDFHPTVTSIIGTKKDNEIANLSNKMTTTVDDDDDAVHQTNTKALPISVSTSSSSPADIRCFLEVPQTSHRQVNNCDLFAPLTTDEADEDELAGFFTGLDDDSFLQQQQQVATLIDEGSVEQMVYPATKRRRVSLENRGVETCSLSSSSSCSSLYSIDTDYDYNCHDDILLEQRKRSNNNSDFFFGSE